MIRGVLVNKKSPWWPVWVLEQMSAEERGIVDEHGGGAGPHARPPPRPQPPLFAFSRRVQQLMGEVERGPLGTTGHAVAFELQWFFSNLIGPQSATHRLSTQTAKRTDYKDIKGEDKKFFGKDGQLARL